MISNHDVTAWRILSDCISYYLVPENKNAALVTIGSYNFSNLGELPFFPRIDSRDSGTSLVFNVPPFQTAMY